MTPLPGDPLPIPFAGRALVISGRQVRMRSATEQDLPDLERLDTEIFTDFAYPFFVLRQLFDVHGPDLLVLDDGTELLGYALAGTSPDKKQGWILGLGVDARLRGHGLGRRLMAAVLDQLRAEGVVEAKLTVDPENSAAIALYGSCGFEQIDERKDYFGPGEHRLIMTLHL